jgi:hypothetical protein
MHLEKSLLSRLCLEIIEPEELGRCHMLDESFIRTKSPANETCSPVKQMGHLCESPSVGAVPWCPSSDDDAKTRIHTLDPDSWRLVAEKT